jgi:hypothetical protein
MALGLTLSALAILSCGGSDDGTERNAALSGAGERNAAGAVPAAAASTPGSGTAVLTVSDDQTQITYELTYSGLTGVQQAHIHVGGPNDNGPIILFLCANGTFKSAAPAAAPPPDCPTGSGTVSGTLTAVNLIPRPATPVVTGVTPAINNFADAVEEIVNGDTYTNVHTAVNTGGEIRGQNL